MKKPLLSIFVATMQMIAATATTQQRKAEPQPKIEQDPQESSRVIHVDERDIVDISTRLRFTTLIVLPKSEQIVTASCGDATFWVVNKSLNLAFVKPSKRGAQTNLNIVATSGDKMRVYSFRLTESSEVQPDLKVFVEPSEQNLLASLDAPRIVTAEAVTDYKAQVEIAQAEAQKARQEASEAIVQAQERARLDVAKAKAALPKNIAHDYKYKDHYNWQIKAMYHDDKFTYIEANPQEVMALYEQKDGKENLIQWTFLDGLYTAPKVVGDGFLQVGKKRMRFQHTEQ